MRRKRSTATMVLTTAIVGLAFLATAAVPAQAGLLVGWDFSTITGASWADAPAPTQTDPNITVVKNLERNWSPGTGGPAYYAWGGNYFAIAPNNTKLGALSAGNYVRFSVTAKPGYELSFTDIPAYNVSRSSTGPNTGIWQYALDSVSFNDIGSQITWGAVTNFTGNPQSSIDLSGISALQNVAAGTTVTFRCVTWGATTTSGSWYLNSPAPQTDPGIDFSVSGTANPVPEPSCFALLGCGLGALGLAAGRKWRRKTDK